MQTVLADLHVHTLLSPCAEVEMTPHHIVMRAAEYGIGAVAITDHNASANVPAALEAAQRYGQFLQLPVIVVWQEGNHGRCDRDHHPGRDVDIVHHLPIHFHNLIPVAGCDTGVDQAAILIQGLRSLADDGLRRVLNGNTSLEELARVVDLTDRM